MRKNRFGSKLLSIKMTLQFIVFGLLVGYFSLLLSTMGTAHKVLKGLSEFIGSSEFADYGQRDWIYESFIDRPEEGRNVLNRLLSVVPPEARQKVSLAIFYRTPTQPWEMLAAKGRLAEPGQDVVTPEVKWAELLERTLEKEMVNHKAVYLGQAERRVLFLDITPERSDKVYVAALEYEQKGLWESIIVTWDENLKVYTFALVFFSLILGQLFTRNLSLSIRRLTDNALKVASGRDADRFSTRCHRMDDLGILSRSLDTMTYNLTHRVRSMETMNQIDRAVLSSLDRKDLLTRVSSFIADQFEGSRVAVLERGKGEYPVLALTPHGESGNPEALALSGEDELLADPPGTPFLWEGEARKRLIPLFGPEKKKETTVGYPLILDEEVTGIIVITRKELDELDRDALRMLADQAGVALKSLTESKVRERLYQGLLLSLTRSVDAKSQWTAGHSERVTRLALLLSDRINASLEFKQSVQIGGMLHDIGKIAIPEAILDKPGRLDDREFNTIRSHPIRGYEILREVPNFEAVHEAVRSHHERWDGSGYPDKLKGEEIPFIARIITICDVYDAITEDRPYRKGFCQEEAREFMVKERGRLFDPDLLDQFMALLEKAPSGIV